MVEEAETLLCEADSLRVKGIAPTDSTLWAETVAALHPWSIFYPTDYAKANYYYGRLLRTKGHHPQAMQCFIDASKAKTNDYNLLGRIWSNIGLMCRLEGNYELAYDVYVKTVELFKLGNNSTAYYYAINNMALQRALQKDKACTYNLLSVIEQECADSAVLTKTLETRAIACRFIEEYDSVVYYVSELQSRGYHEPTGFVLKAQSYDCLGYVDSAFVYAQIALACPCSLNDSINMLYVISHNDPTLTSDTILIITSERADKQFAYTRQQESLAIAVEVLQQELSRPYDWRWIYIVLGFITLIGGCIGIRYAIRSHRLMKKFDIEMYATLEEKCCALQKMTDRQLIATIYWDNYLSMCSYLNAHMNNFVNKLLVLDTTLTEQNIRLSTLILIGCSYKRTASMLNLSENSMSKLKQILADKLGTKIKDLHTFLLTLASKNSSSLS